MTHLEYETLLEAQLRHTQELVDSYLDFTGSDDRWDYLNSALHLSHLMMRGSQLNEGGMELFLLDLLPLSQFACDGVCVELYAWQTVERLRRALSRTDTREERWEIEEAIEEMEIEQETRRETQ